MVGFAHQVRIQARKYFMIAYMAYFADNHKRYKDPRHHLAELRKLLGQGYFQSLYGHWEVCWGPVVEQFSVGSIVLPRRNTFFVVLNKEQNEYVISIAGVNPTSVFGWFVEDFEVSELIPWRLAKTYGVAKARGGEALLNLLPKGEANCAVNGR